MEQPKYAPTLTNYGYLNQHFDFMITYNLANTYPCKILYLLFVCMLYNVFLNVCTIDSYIYIYCYYLIATQIPNLPVTYFPLHKLPIEWLLEKPRAFEEKNGYGKSM